MGFWSVGPHSYVPSQFTFSHFLSGTTTLTEAGEHLSQVLRFNLQDQRVTRTFRIGDGFYAAFL